LDFNHNHQSNPNSIMAGGDYRKYSISIQVLRNHLNSISQSWKLFPGVGDEPAASTHNHSASSILPFSSSNALYSSIHMNSLDSVKLDPAVERWQDMVSYNISLPLNLSKSPSFLPTTQPLPLPVSSLFDYRSLIT